MRNGFKHSGFVIALAWPATYCKQPGSWYDSVTLLFGVNINNYYKVGHATVVLVDVENKKFHYFDFGRYHAPYGYGRIRSGETDYDLIIRTIPKISEDGKEIENYDELLNELQNNPACHGEGTLYASYIPANFKSAYNMAMQMQQTESIPYGPFIKKGSNCSRFVNTVLRAAKPQLKYKLSLKYLVPLTPTPISNVNSLINKRVLPKLLKTTPFLPNQKLDKLALNSTLMQPKKHPKIPENAQWLSGEGAGSWFTFKFKNKFMFITRFTTNGSIECSGFYETQNNLDLINFAITYPSNCKLITLTKNDKVMSFERVIE